MGLTKERNTRRINEMEALSVLVKVECGTHQDLHVLQDGCCTCRNMVPSPLQTMDRSGAQSRYDGRQS